MRQVMKVYLDYKINESGKGKFLSRLIPALSDIGVDVVARPEGCSAALSIGVFEKTIGLPKVLRIDGIRVKKSASAKWYNNKIKDSIKHADAVIWQSEFAKNYIKKKIKAECKKEYVIHNGACSDEFNVVPAKSNTKYNVILAAKWGTKKTRKYKGIKKMLEIAREHCAKNPDVSYWVAGETLEAFKHGRITFLGTIKSKTMAAYYKLSDVMLNLATLDWCPNATIEAIVAGVPVVCYDNSGVGEISQGYGTVLSINSANEEIISSVETWFGKNISHTDKYNIDNIAEQYKRVFEYVSGK